MITNHPLILKTRDYAIKAHAGTNHLYDGKPYEFHLQMVFDVAVEFIDKVGIKKLDDIHEIIGAACWGHDLIEDCRQTRNDVLKATENEEVTEIIYALTNDKGRTRKERAGENYYKGIRETKGAVFVKLCDRIANVTYSKQTGESMLEKYKLENPEFLHYLFLDNNAVKQDYRPMITRLCELFD